MTTRMGEGVVEEGGIMKETNFLAGLFQQIVADCKVQTILSFFTKAKIIDGIASLKL